MDSVFYSADSRGPTDFGWLKSYHSFSFGNFMDPERMGFGALRVLNDDHVDGGKGFQPHPHENMEIISIPLSGALKHKDSAGNEAVIRTGDIQIMSAGTGITHSEMNASEAEPVEFLQIWVFPQAKGLTPRYDQKTPDWQKQHNGFTTIVSPDGGNGAVQIMQKAWLTTGHAPSGQILEYKMQDKENGLFGFLLEGRIDMAGHSLGPRDAVGVIGTDALSLKSIQESRFLLIEVPMKDFIS